MADNSNFVAVLENQRQQRAAQAQQEQQQQQQSSVSPILGGVAAGSVANSLIGGGSAAAAPATASAIGSTAGAITVPAGAAIPEGYTAVASASSGGGITAIPTTSIGGTAPSPFGLSGIGSAGNYVLPAVGAIGTYDVLSHKVGPVRGAVEGAASGAAIGSYFGPTGALVGAGIGGTIGGVKGLSEGKKSKDQTNRDEVRSKLKGGKLIDDDYNVTLADGTKVDVGKDGHYTIAGHDGKLIHPAYEADWSNPYMSKAVAYTNPLIEMITSGMSDKARSDMVGQLSNAFVSNAKDEKTVQANVVAMYNKAGITTSAQANTLIDALVTKGSITKEEAAVYKSTVAQILPSGLNATAYNSPNGQASASIRYPRSVPNVPMVTPRQTTIQAGIPNVTPSQNGAKQFAETLSSSILGQH